jgi:1-acyl-sn-glycerol-3-phosphate acyltransferase
VLLRLVSYAFWALVVLTSPVFFLIAVVLWAVTLPFDRRKVVLHLFTSAWAVFYVWVNPVWKVRVTGRERLPWKGSAVIVANHASLVDILVLFELFRPFKWVSKVENFRVPFIGWNMSLNGYVPLVRGDRASVVAMLARCGELIRKGNPVLFFPEGTRTRDGRLQAFKDGAFELAVEHGVPVIPVALHGTRAALPRRGFVFTGHVDCRIEVLEPLDPAAYDGVGGLRDAARERIAAALGDEG